MGLSPMKKNVNIDIRSIAFTFLKHKNMREENDG